MLRFSLLFLLAPLSLLAYDYESEPNNEIADASLIRSGQTLQGNVASVSDFDYYHYSATATGSIRVMFRRIPTGYQFNIATITVLDSDQTALASVDAYAPRNYTSFDVGVEEGRDYYIEIVGCPSESGHCSYWRSEVYELIVVQLPNPYFETEPNDSVSSADSVVSNSWIFAQHSSQDDIDYFKLELPSAGDFIVQVSRPTDGYQYNLGNVALLDGDNSLVNSDDIYAPDGQGRVVLSVAEAGTYYLKLSSCEGGSRCEITYSDQYQVITSFQPSKDDNQNPYFSEDIEFNGLFYDPSNSGHGFDFNVHESGLTVFYYGHTVTGERLWLISGTYTGNLEYEVEIQLEMFAVTNGTFGVPIEPATPWGTITVTFTDCDTGYAAFSGDDGSLDMGFVRLTGLKGIECQ